MRLLSQIQLVGHIDVNNKINGILTYEKSYLFELYFKNY